MRHSKQHEQLGQVHPWQYRSGEVRGGRVLPSGTRTGGAAVVDLMSMMDDQRRAQKAGLIIRGIQPRSSPAQVLNSQMDAMAVIQQVTDPWLRDRLQRDLKFSMQVSGHAT